jgi:hypothetical protein
VQTGCPFFTTLGAFLIILLAASYSTGSQRQAANRSWLGIVCCIVLSVFSTRSQQVREPIMSRFNAQVVCMAAERDAQKVKKAFLQLVHADLIENAERIEPIPAALLTRMEHLRAKAQANRNCSDLLEG